MTAPYVTAQGGVRTLVVDPDDASWCPPGTPADVMTWAYMETPSGTHGFAKTSGTQTYEFLTDAGGRAYGVKVYVEGELAYHWQRYPLDGTWPGTHEWQALEIRGQALVPED